VSFPGRSERTLGDFVTAIEKGPDGYGNRDEWFRMIFAFHYLYPLDESHPRFASLRRSLQTAERMGSTVVLYITPVNYDAGRELLGPPFDESVAGMIEASLRTVKESVTSPDSVVIEDLSALLPAGDFFIDREVLGHINEFGRMKVADALAASVKRVLRT
jgi:hypothetical protein